jgi:hypothetical protein
MENIIKVVIDYKLSTWATLFFIIFAAAGMQPGFYTLIMLPLLIGCGFAIRGLARLEGKYIERSK